MTDMTQSFLHLDFNRLAILCCTIAFLTLVIRVFFSLSKIGESAFKQGAHPDAPKAFSELGIQLARICIVGLIVLATLLLAFWGKLDQGSSGILSGIAGYVLGGGNMRPNQGWTNQMKSKKTDSEQPI